MLMDGAESGHVGGPLIEVGAAPAAAGVPVGLGRPVVLFTFAAPKEGRHQKHGPRVLTASIAAVNPLGNGLGGPIVGIVEWGSGNSAQFAAEVDVPVSPGMSGASLDNLLSGSGVVVSVPGDYIRISARNDANLLPRPAVAGEQHIGDPTTVTLATGAVGVGNRPGSTSVPLTRYAAFNTGAGAVAVNGTVVLQVPPFARSLQVFRAGLASASGLSVTMNGTIFLDGPINIAASAPSPSIPIPAGTSTVVIKNLGPDTLLSLGAIWAIGL